MLISGKTEGPNKTLTAADVNSWPAGSLVGSHIDTPDPASTTNGSDPRIDFSSLELKEARYDSAISYFGDRAVAAASPLSLEGIEILLELPLEPRLFARGQKLPAGV